MTLDSSHLVQAFYVAALAWIGWRARARPGESTAESELLGDRRIPWWAVLLSVLGSEISALTLVGVPASAYSGNWSYLQVVMGAVLGRWIVARFFVPAFYRHGVVSIYEFLLTRYGPWTRSVVTGVFLLTRTLMSGVRLCAGAQVLAVAFGLPFNAALVVLSLVGLAFCASGGIRAVVWSETLQMSTMIVGVLLTGATLLLRQGWPGGAQVFDFSADLSRPYTFWSCLFGFTLFNTAVFGTDYDMAQRALTARDSGQSRWAVVGSALAEIPVFLTLLLIGSMLRQFYGDGPGAPVANQALTHYIVSELPAPLRGLLVAAVVSVVLSTYESALTALAGSFVIDVWKPLRGLCPPVEEQAESARVRRANRFAILGFAGLLLAVAWASQGVESLLNFGLEVGTYSYGTLLAVFAVALWRRGDRPAAPDRPTALVAVPLSVLGVIGFKLSPAGSSLAFPWVVAGGSLLAWLLIEAVSRLRR